MDGSVLKVLVGGIIDFSGTHVVDRIILCNKAAYSTVLVRSNRNVPRASHDVHQRIYHLYAKGHNIGE